MSLTCAVDFQNTQGIIFVVDSNDRERITEAREECQLVATSTLRIPLTLSITVQRMLSEDELREALLLVFANKQASLALRLANVYLTLGRRIYPTP